jgi:uncharacterized damage-inducible protein DinB
MTPSDLIPGGYRMAKAMVHRMVDDLTPSEFRHQPVAGANSAAWIVGHLAVTLHRIGRWRGATDLPDLPQEMVAKLTATGQPAGEQSAMPESAELLSLFDLCADRVMEAMKDVSADELARPPQNPVPLATNNAEAMLFGAMHMVLHVGQLSTIRRSLGKPPLR